jgi:hypothetical protein
MAPCTRLAQQYWSITDDSVQGYWKTFGVLDTLIPLEMSMSNVQCYTPLSPSIKHKINQRKYLLYKFKLEKSPIIKRNINIFEKIIKQFLNKLKIKAVRKMIYPECKNYLWNAVKTAKDVNVSSKPRTLFESNLKIWENCVPDRFDQ